MFVLAGTAARDGGPESAYVRRGKNSSFRSDR